MTELEKRAEEYSIREIPFIECISQLDLERLVKQAYLAGATEATKELQEQNKHLYNDLTCTTAELTEKDKQIEELKKQLAITEHDREHNDYELAETYKKIAELETQIEKLIHFVLIKTDCCDVCPITDTCINSEGTCPYASILSKDEEAVTRKWLIQNISKEIKEK